MGDFVYSGQENLEAMRSAKNYNKYLINIIETQIKNIKKNNVKILDFGSGIGTYADYLKEKGYKVDCLELDEDQIKKLRQKGYKVYDSIGKLPEYDLIYSLNVFEHIENDITVYKELSKKLSSKGRIITYVPAFQILFSSMDKLVEHHRRYRACRLKIMNEQANTSIVILKYCDPLGFVAALIFKYFGNNNGAITSKSVKLYDEIAFRPSKYIEFVTNKFIGKNALMISERK